MKALSFQIKIHNQFRKKSYGQKTIIIRFYQNRFASAERRKEIITFISTVFATGVYFGMEIRVTFVYQTE